MTTSCKSEPNFHLKDSETRVPPYIVPQDTFQFRNIYRVKQLSITKSVVCDVFLFFQVSDVLKSNSDLPVGPHRQVDIESRTLIGRHYIESAPTQCRASDVSQLSEHYTFTSCSVSNLQSARRSYKKTGDISKLSEITSQKIKNEHTGTLLIEGGGIHCKTTIS